MADKHKIFFVQKLLLALLIAVSMSSCERKPLYLQTTGQMEIETSVYNVELDYLWGLDWQAEWQYDWDETKYGPIGYTKPSGVRATIYDLDAEKQRDNYFTQNFLADGGRVSLLAGSWYDMLFYNNGTNYILFNSDNYHNFYHASTRASMRSNYNRGEITRSYTDMNQPDELFGTFIENLEVSLDPNDYEIEYDEDGSIIYVYSLKAKIRPHTMIYLIQVMLINNINAKGERIVKGAQGLTLSGMASGVDLFTRVNDNDSISLTTDDIKQLQTDKELTLPNGSKQQGDIFAARMLTWGLPGIDPLGITRDGTKQEKTSCYVGIGLTLSNNAIYAVQADVTEQINKRKSGGIITIVVDASKLPEPPQPGGESGGGFDADVNEWDNEINADIII